MLFHPSLTLVSLFDRLGANVLVVHHECLGSCFIATNGHHGEFGPSALALVEEELPSADGPVSTGTALVFCLKNDKSHTHLQVAVFKIH